MHYWWHSGYCYKLYKVDNVGLHGLSTKDEDDIRYVDNTVFVRNDEAGISKYQRPRPKNQCNDSSSTVLRIWKEFSSLDLGLEIK